MRGGLAGLGILLIGTGTGSGDGHQREAQVRAVFVVEAGVDIQAGQVGQTTAR